MLNTFISLAMVAESAGSQVQQNPDPGMAALFFKLLLSLAIIIVLIYLILKFIKNQQGLELKKRARQKDWIHIVDYQGLGTNKGIYLLKIINKTYAVAVSENSISTICEFANSEEGQSGFVRSDDSNQEAVRTDILGIVRGILSKKPLLKNKGDFQKELNNKLSEQLDEQRERTHRILAKLNKGGTDVE